METTVDNQETVDQAIQLLKQAEHICQEKEPTELEQEAKTEYFSLLYSASNLLTKHSHLFLDKNAPEVWDIHKKLKTCYAEGIGTAKDTTKSQLHEALASIYFEKSLEELRKESRRRRIKRLPLTIFSWIFMASLVVVCLTAIIHGASGIHIVMKAHYWLVLLLDLVEWVVCLFGSYYIVSNFIYAWTDEYDNPIEHIMDQLSTTKKYAHKIYRVHIKNEKWGIRRVFWLVLVVLQAGGGVLHGLLCLAVIPLAIYFLYLAFFLLR